MLLRNIREQKNIEVIVRIKIVLLFDRKENRTNRKIRPPTKYFTSFFCIFFFNIVLVKVLIILNRFILIELNIPMVFLNISFLFFFYLIINHHLRFHNQSTLLRTDKI